MGENRESERSINLYVRATFQALVDAFIPPHMTNKTKHVQVPGALELHVSEYVIFILEHSISLPVKAQLNFSRIFTNRLEY